jgi:2-polyprenyl-3-methyl-5-hydroxy-6-metoxy-1,4-benzoquinol methylase
MDAQAINNEFYNAYFDKFDKIPFEEILPQWILKYVPLSTPHVLEIGAGSGALAHWMTQIGYDVICLEPAEKAAEKGRSKGLNIQLTPLQDFQTNHTYDAILAISSLIHIPKAELPDQIKRIAHLLKPQGIFLVSFLEGTTEGYEDPTHTGKLRFFAKYSLNELEKMLSPYFSILQIEKIESKKMNQTFYLLALKLAFM